MLLVAILVVIIISHASSELCAVGPKTPEARQGNTVVTGTLTANATYYAHIVAGAENEAYVDRHHQGGYLGYGFTAFSGFRPDFIRVGHIKPNRPARTI